MKSNAAHLDELGGEAPGDADPVGGGDEAVSGHRAEDERAQLLPLLAEVVRVDLSEEDGQDHGQDRHQVHLPPVLRRQQGHRSKHTRLLLTPQPHISYKESLFELHVLINLIHKCTKTHSFKIIQNV